MRVVITGGAGFLGKLLAQKILSRGQLNDAHGVLREVSELVLVDMTAAQDEPWLADSRVSQVVGDIADRAVLARALTAATGSIFHLAAVVSGQAEADFDIGMRVNVDATRTLLELTRALPEPPKFVFTSSIAVFGGNLPAVLPDDQRLTPQGSYGAQKAMGELLVSDMSRRGMIDGRALRLPTITVRPGKPNKAASSFASGIIREPLAGVDAVCPVVPATRMWVQSPPRVIENLLIGHDAPATAFGFDRSISVPGISVAVGDMVASLRRVAGDAVAGRVSWQLDPAIDRLVSSWPQAFAADRGRALGMTADDDFDDIVRAYMAATAASRQ
ncbi:D-erythronate dehydrogenase [Casimicrobium huifangae]|uniref:D-erythronate dehydrogenase n=1 Tax=Casimicrobium huifangae TaxID=2591109 RepID=UPI0012EB7AC5|nr:D-erythronate dehydrogenase [Casimicrobium huifangae]